MSELQGDAIANAQGIATLTLTIPGVRKGWQLQAIALFVDIGSPIPQCTVYLNQVTPGAVLGFKRAGDRGSIIGDGDVFYTGQTLIVQWTTAAVGARCRANARGNVL